MKTNKQDTETSSSLLQQCHVNSVGPLPRIFGDLCNQVEKDEKIVNLCEIYSTQVIIR